MSSSTADVAAPPDRSRATLAWALFVVAVASAVAGLAFSIVTWRASDVEALAIEWADLVFVLAFLMFPIVGVLIASRRPENSLGWLLLGIGLVHGLTLAQGAYSSWTVYGDPGAPRGVAFAAAFSWTWIPVVAVPAAFLPLLFPDGHLPSRRWRWFAWVLAVGMVMASIGITFTGGELEEYPGVDNPLAVSGLDVLTIGIFVLPIGVVGAVISLILRYRRAEAVERQQIRWVAAAAAVMGVTYTAALLATWITDTGWNGTGPTWVVLLQTGCLAAFGLIPAAMGVAILRYHLYDLGLVIRKTLLIAMLAIFITAVYVAVVAGVGALVGAAGSPVLSALAAAIVALAFQPARRAAGRLADRVVYGERATPYELLSEFSDRVGATYAADDVLPRMARLVGEGIGAERTQVWVRSGEALRVAASWQATPSPDPSRAAEEPAAPVAVPDDAAALTLPGAETVYPIEDRGDLLGALAVSMPPSDPMDPSKDALVHDLTGQTGLIMRNVRLTADLRARLDDLRAAQRRLVAAQDEERRRLERNIHDGAQQQLVALQVRQRLAEQLIDRDPEKAKAMLAELQADTATALDDLRDLARGIYPPLLADQGLSAALEAQGRRSTVPVTVRATGSHRYAPDAESAVYFSVLEALQNVGKYASATSVAVDLELEPERIGFSVRDDGRGFDPAATGYGTGLQGIADRLGALEGSVTVDSAPGQGTSVRGAVPAPALPPGTDADAEQGPSGDRTPRVPVGGAS